MALALLSAASASSAAAAVAAQSRRQFAGHPPLELTRQLWMLLRVAVEQSLPFLLAAGAGFAAIPGSADVGGDRERRRRASRAASRAAAISSTPSGAPWVASVPCRFGAPKPMMVLQQISVGWVVFCFAARNAAVDRLRIVAVDIGDHLPAVGAEARRRVVAEPAVHFAVDGNAVVVVEADELA